MLLCVYFHVTVAPKKTKSGRKFILKIYAYLFPIKKITWGLLTAISLCYFFNNSLFITVKKQPDSFVASLAEKEAKID